MEDNTGDGGTQFIDPFEDVDYTEGRVALGGL